MQQLIATTTCRGFVGSHEPVGEESEGFASRGLLQDDEMGKLAVRGHVDCGIHSTMRSCCHVIKPPITSWRQPEDVPGQPRLPHVFFFLHGICPDWLTARNLTYSGAHVRSIVRTWT